MLFRNTDLITVITGARRCGKSSLLDLIRMTIKSEEVVGRGFVNVNLESKSTGIKTEGQLYNPVRSRLSDKDRTYFYFVVPPLEGFWRQGRTEGVLPSRFRNFKNIRVPKPRRSG